MAEATESNGPQGALQNGASSGNQLKMQRSGLTRAWRIERSCDPFYSGGKVEVLSSGAAIICMHDNNLHTVPIGDNVDILEDSDASRAVTGSKLSLFSKQASEDFVDTITCFAMHPHKAEVVLATQKGVLRHYAMTDSLLDDFQRIQNPTSLNSGGEKRPQSDDATAAAAAGANCLRAFRAHQMPILTMNFDPTGSLVATGGADRRVCVWDIYRGYCTHSFRDHTDILHSVQFHPDGERLQLFSTAEDHTVRVFDLRDSRCVAVFDQAHVSVPTSLAFRQSDGYLMASTGRDKVVCFYELRAMQHIKSIPLMEELESCMFLHPQHSAALTRSSNTNSSSSSSSGRKGSAKSSAASQQGAVFLTAGEQGVIRIFLVAMAGKSADSFSMQPLAVLDMYAHAAATLRSSSSSSSSSGSADSLRGILALHFVSNASSAGAAARILAVTKDHNLCFYSMEQLAHICQQEESGATEPQKLLIGTHGEILDMVLIPRPQSTSATAADGGSGTIISSNNSSSSSKCAQLKFSLALVTNSAQVRIIDERFSCSVLEGHKDIVLAVDASPDGCWLVTSSKDFNCMVWSTQRRRCVAVAKGHTDAVGCISVSHSLHSYASRQVFMVSGGGDKILKRWALPVHTYGGEGAAGSEVALLQASHSTRAHDKDINTVCTAPNDQLIASGSQDKTIKIWKAADLSPVATLRGHKRGVWKVQFSPIEKLLVSCSGDRTVKIWSVGDSFGIVKTLDGHTASVLSVRFVNHGLQLMSAAADGLLRLWTVRTGECEATFEQHEDRVWAMESLDLSPNEKVSAAAPTHFVFSGGSESRLLVWRDFTVEDEMQRMEEVERTVLLEQQMGNDLREKKFDRALRTALELGHSLKVLNILRTILEAEGPIAPDSRRQQQQQQQQQRDMSDASVFHREWARRLDAYLQQLSVPQVEKVVGYLVDWNMNSKHCYVSQVVINYLLRTFRVEELQKMSGFTAALAALESYSERHFQRLDRLNQASYMLEFFTARIGLLPREDAVTQQETAAIGSAALADIARGRAPASAAAAADLQKREKEEALLLIFTPVSQDTTAAAFDGDSDSDDSSEHDVRSSSSSTQKGQVNEANDSEKKSSKKRAAKQQASTPKTARAAKSPKLK